VIGTTGIAEARLELVRDERRDIGEAVRVAHSLSYHENTFTIRLPTTLVSGASKIDECGLPLRSTVPAALAVFQNPLSGPPAAAFIAALTDFTSASFSTVTVRSTIETFEVGTRIAIPSSLPLSAGSTRPIAFAAPVEVGIIDIPAARARLRIVVRTVLQHLIRRIAVNGRHQAVRYAKTVVQHLANRREAIRGA